MKTATVYVLIGLPGSGKSTWSKNKMADDPGCLIVNRDALRTMIKGEYCFNPMYESTIRQSALSLMELFIDDGWDVIMDETHVTRKSRDEVFSRVGDKARIVAVVFEEQERNLEFRMKDPRTYDEAKWADVIAYMKKLYEPIDTQVERYNAVIRVKDVQTN